MASPHKSRFGKNASQSMALLPDFKLAFRRLGSGINCCWNETRALHSHSVQTRRRVLDTTRHQSAFGVVPREEGVAHMFKHRSVQIARRVPGSLAARAPLSAVLLLLLTACGQATDGDSSAMRSKEAQLQLDPAHDSDGV